MGGQACVFYGAAEFSRDVDLLILSDPANLAILRSALDDLSAEPISVPPLEPEHLQRGHAVHFRCLREDVARLRIDLMSSLRGVSNFEELWNRRTTLEVEGEPIDLLAIEDLVLAKKTQRNKDWPMIQRLLEESYFSHQGAGPPALVAFWLRELRTPELLILLTANFPENTRALSSRRPVLDAAIQGDIDSLTQALDHEEKEERSKDRQYWEPLKRELEQFRLAKSRHG
jgi:hypothetical protein